MNNYDNDEGSRGGRGEDTKKINNDDNDNNNNDDDDDHDEYDRIERCKSNFFTISSLRRELSQVARAPSCANRAFITCNMSCATWYVGTAQLLSLTQFKSHLFDLIHTHAQKLITIQPQQKSQIDCSVPP